MSNLNPERTLHLVVLAAVFLLRPVPVVADGGNGLPNPPNVTTGTQGTITDVTIQGRTFKQGREVISISDADYVSVDVEIYAPDGAGSRVNLQRHTTIKYRWFMLPLPDGQDKQLTETITVKSTVQNKDTGKTTTERDDSYKVETDWVSVGTTPYALKRCHATSGWNSDGGDSGSFGKLITYANEASDDRTSWIKRQVLSVKTDYNNVDPVFGGWSFSRRTEWNINTGIVTMHTVSINGVNQQNPFGWAMTERAVVGQGMDPQVSDPSVPPLSSIPFEWPREPGFV
jgi:hypothetical protein